MLSILLDKKNPKLLGPYENLTTTEAVIYVRFWEFRVKINLFQCNSE